MRLLICLLVPTVTLSCLRTATTTTSNNRAPISQDVRLAQRAPFQCTLSPFKLCLEGWICDSSSISISTQTLKCEDGSAVLVRDGNSLILVTKSECKDKLWFINDKPFTKEVEATCGSIVPRGKSLRRNEEVVAEVQVHRTEVRATTTTPAPTIQTTTVRSAEWKALLDDWRLRMKEVQERVNENEQRRRRVVASLIELRKKGEMDIEKSRRIQTEIAGHNTIRHELNQVMTKMRQERMQGLRPTSTTAATQPPLPRESFHPGPLPGPLPSPHPGPLPSSHIPSYAELLALQGYDAMPQIYSTPPPNPFDSPPRGLQSFEHLPISLTSLLPYSSYRRCGRILQSSSDCPDGRICSSFSHLGEHRITCPNGGHVAVELPEGHLELMVSSLICPEGGTEWTAENDHGQRGQRVGRDVMATCIQECACTPLSASPVCPPSQRCSPASFLVDMDDQCMLYECEEGKTLFVRSRYGWQPASHLVCGPGGDYLVEGKDKVGSNPTVTCVVESGNSSHNHPKRRAHRRKVYAN